MQLNLKQVSWLEEQSQYLNANSVCQHQSASSFCNDVALPNIALFVAYLDFIFSSQIKQIRCNDTKQKNAHLNLGIDVDSSK